MIERKYECLECALTWLVFHEKESEPVPPCPVCSAGKNLIVRTKKEPKLKVGKPMRKLAKEKRGMPMIGNPIYNKIGKEALKIAEAAGFSNFRDEGLREGDISAPPLTSLVAQVQDNMMGGGWNGNHTAMIPGARAADTGGNSTLSALQAGKVPDMMKTGQLLK